ncbi:MAG: nucleotidyl transferase AbiEii/AbiGii toxin family protein, partial [Thiogranum sp.]
AAGKTALNNRGLFEDVVQHKQVFFNTSYANYDACLTSDLHLIPGDQLIKALRTDYEKMLSAGMMYGGPLPFDKIISDIQEIEQAINDW